MTDDARRRGLIALLAFTFFMVVGFTMVMPLVAVHFVSDRGLTAAAVGLALAARQLTQQGLAVFGGALADRFSIRALICGGVLLRAAGFVMLAGAADLPQLLAALVLSALGGVLFEMPYQAAIVALTTDDDRPRYYSLNNTVVGVATTAGPLLGVALLRLDFGLVCLAAAACFGVTFLLALLLLPPVRSSGERRDLGYGLGLVGRDGAFLLLTALMVVYWFTAVQINISFPLLAEHLTGSSDSVGVMFALNALLTMLLQYPLTHLLERRFAPRQVLVAGVLVMSLGVGALALAQTFELFLACVALFTLGMLLARPHQQALAVAMADSRALGTYLGVHSLGLAIGGGVGTFAGGWLIDAARASGWHALPWLVFWCVGLLAALGFVLMGRQPPQEAQEAQSVRARA